MGNALQQYPVPSIGAAANNALSMKGAALNNQLTEKKIGNYDDDRNYLLKQRDYAEEDRKRNLLEHAEDREAEKQVKGYQREATAISTALKAGNTAQANQIYKQLGGKSESGVTIAGQDVSIDYGQSTIKGPSGAVSELMEQVARDPGWITDSEKAAKTKAWMSARGISFEQRTQRKPQPKSWNGKKSWKPIRQALKKTRESMDG